MRHKSRILVLVIAMVCAFIALTGVAGAATWRSGDTINIPKGTVIDDDLYVGAGNVTIDGDVTGNVFIGGGNVIVNGNIGKSLFASAGTVIVNGKVGDDIIAAGGQVTFNGPVAKDIVAAGGTIGIGSTVGRDVLVGGGTISLDGIVSRNLLAGTDKINLNGPVAGDFKFSGNNIAFGNKGMIGGNLDYYSDKEIPIASGTVKGKVAFHETVRQAQRQANTGGSAVSAFLFGIFWFVVFLIGRLIVGAFFAGMTPKAAIFTADAIKSRPWASLGIGALVLFLGPTVILVAALTLIGLPAAGIALDLFIGAIYMSMIVTGTYLGRLVLMPMMGREPHPVAAMALGVTTLAIVTSIPFLGWLISFVSVLFGTGALTLGLAALVKAGKNRPAPTA